MSDFAPILAREILRLHEDVLGAMQATGRTAAATRNESGAEYARLLGPGHLKALRDGRRPDQRPPIQPIIEWLQAKRLKLSPYAVANNIAARGTRLFRGEDPRFKKPTDTFAAPIAAARPCLRAALFEASRTGLRSDLVNFTISRL